MYVTERAQNKHIYVSLVDMDRGWVSNFFANFFGECVGLEEAYHLIPPPLSHIAGGGGGRASRSARFRAQKKSAARPTAQRAATAGLGELRPAVCCNHRH